MSLVIRRAVLVPLIAALASCSMFDYSGIVSHKYALVYGVTSYVSTADPHWNVVQNNPKLNPNLSYPDSDAKSMALILRQEGYDVVSRWVDSAGDEWLGTNTNPNPSVRLANIQTDTGGASGPSKANIQPDITTYFAGKIGPDDVFVFYFSGHGMQVLDGGVSHEYFVPLGAVAWSPPQGEYAAYEGLSVRDDEFGTYVSALDTPRRVVILDTCNSGGFIGNQLEVDWTPQAYTGGVNMVGPGTLIQAISNYASMQSSPTGLSPYGAQVLSAAGRDELSWEAGNPFSHGIMTYFLLQGLQNSTADLNHDGHVTILEAFAYAQAGVQENWNAAQGSARAFEPHVSGGPVDFVLF
jgi:hypothetical protein